MSLGYADKLKRKKNVGGQLGAPEFFDGVGEVEEKMQKIVEWVRKKAAMRLETLPNESCRPCSANCPMHVTWLFHYRRTGTRVKHEHRAISVETQSRAWHIPLLRRLAALCLHAMPPPPPSLNACL